MIPAGSGRGMLGTLGNSVPDLLMDLCGAGGFSNFSRAGPTRLGDSTSGFWTNGLFDMSSCGAGVEQGVMQI